VILAGEQMGLWDVEKDPRSADFMNIRLGKIRVDPWGGTKQFVTLFARMLPVAASIDAFGKTIPILPPGGQKSTTTGELNPPRQATTFMRFIRGKAAPMVTLMADTWSGSDFLGDPVDNTSFSQWAKRIAPLAVQDIYDAFTEQGGWSAAASASALVGANVLTYDLPRWEELDEYYMIKATERLSTTKRRMNYRRQNPLQEARLFVRGDITTISTRRARSLVLDIMSEHDVAPVDVRGYEKMFKDVPVPEGRKVSDEEKAALKRTEGTINSNGLRRPIVSEAPSTPGPAAPGVERGQAGIKEIFAAFPIAGKADAFAGLESVWGGGSLTASQQAYLEGIYQRFPLGQENFNTWLKQTLRQTFEAGRDTLN
jgi:hypothetical protein